MYKYIDGFDGYQFHDDGSIFSEKRNRFLKQRLRKDGYKDVWLSNNGVSKIFLSHRIICKAFFGDFPISIDVNHKDGNRSNNALSNLELCSRSENCIHGYRVNGRIHVNSMQGKHGKNNPLSRPVIAKSIINGSILEYESLMDAVKDGFHSSNISLCCNGKKTSYKGYTWSFKDVC